MDDMSLAKELFDQEMMRVDKDKLKEAAKSIHALYETFINEGFTKMEAIHLVDTTIASGLRGGK